MKSQAFLMKANEFFGVPFDRLQKLATVLRKQGLYPDGRRENDVTLEECAHLIYLLAISPNPFTNEAESVAADYKKLVSQSGNFFIHDLAEILSEGGALLPSKKGVNWVHHISISIDRPFALIAFQKTDIIESEIPGEEDTTYTITGERVYGENTPKAHERFAILKKSMIWNLGMLLQESYQDAE